MTKRPDIAEQLTSREQYAPHDPKAVYRTRPVALFEEAAARIRELEAALRPFASLGSALPEHYTHRGRYGPGHPRFWHEIDPADIWNARAALDPNREKDST